MKSFVDIQSVVPEAHEPGGVHIAVVCSGTGVVWVDVAATRAELAARLVRFLEPRVEYQLWDESATQFRRLVEQGQPQRAIDLYFASAGERWDEERLTIVHRPDTGGVARTLPAMGGAPAARPDRAASGRRWVR